MYGRDLGVQVAQYIADNPSTGAACASVFACAVAWLPIVTGWLQLISTCVAIAAGVMAFVWHKGNIDERRRGNGDESGKDQESSPCERDSAEG